MATRRALASAVTMLSEAFGAEPTPHTFTVYDMALRDIPDEALERGVMRTIREARFVPSRSLPRPADVRAFCGVPRPEEAAEVAWEVATRTARTQGAYCSVDFEDRTINAAIRSMGGWQRFCALDQEQAQRFGRQQFAKAYTAYSKNGLTSEAGAPLAGLEEISARSQGLEGGERRKVLHSGKSIAIKPANWRKAEDPPQLPAAVRGLLNG